MKRETQEHYQRYFVQSLLLLRLLWVPLAGRCSNFYPVGVSPRPTVCVTLKLSFVIQKWKEWNSPHEVLMKVNEIIQVKNLAG